MTDRGIIFSAPMVLALLAGRKTQTRRLATSPLRRCEPGDRLYVRECAQEVGEGYLVIYRADYPDCVPVRFDNVPALEDIKSPWRPSIHMPRRWSRLTLLVTDVRRQRLQEISERDARAEGVEASGWEGSDVPDPCRTAFRDLWNCLHGKPGESWEENPEIVALTFILQRRNIDF